MEDYVKIKKTWFYVGVVVFLLLLLYSAASVIGFDFAPIGECHLVCTGGPMI